MCWWWRNEITLNQSLIGNNPPKWPKWFKPTGFRKWTKFKFRWTSINMHLSCHLEKIQSCDPRWSNRQHRHDNRAENPEFNHHLIPRFDDAHHRPSSQYHSVERQNPGAQLWKNQRIRLSAKPHERPWKRIQFALERVAKRTREKIRLKFLNNYIIIV